MCEFGARTEMGIATMGDKPGDPPTPGVDRRKFLAVGALIGGVAAAAASSPEAIPSGETARYSGTVPWKEGAADNPTEAGGTGYRFFGPDEAAFIEAACARIIPGDRADPGALEANVPIFIDRQLGGKFGRGDHYYLQGPWPEGQKTQGYQTRFSPAELYRHGITATESWCRAKHGKLFRELTPDKQDEVLKALESGDAKLEGVSAKTFFAMLLQNVQEGFWADPIYGGNKDMVGWKAIGFPGAHYDYSAWVERHNEPWPHAPVGLGGRPDWQER